MDHHHVPVARRPRLTTCVGEGHAPLTPRGSAHEPTSTNGAGMTEHELDVESIPLDAGLRDWLLVLASERRFGERDRRGTVNLIDDAARVRAAECVQTGAPGRLGRRWGLDPSLRCDGRPGC